MLRGDLQSKQQAQSKKFTQRKLCLNIMWRFRQHVIYAAKKFYDKVFLNHGKLHFCEWFGHQNNKNFSVAFQLAP